MSSNEPNQCEPNQSTCRQPLPKVCLQQFHGQGLIWDLSGPFGSFWIGDNVRGRNLSNLNFWVSEVKKVKFGSAEKIGCECRNVCISESTNI